MLQLWVNPPIVARQKKALKLTDACLGAHLRMSPKTVSRYINRGAAVPYGAARLLAEKLEVEMSELFEERQSPAPRSGRERRVDASLGNVLRGTTKADAKAAS